MRKVSCDYDTIQKSISSSLVVEEKFPFNLTILEDKSVVHSKLIWVTIRYTSHRGYKAFTSITVGNEIDSIIYDEVNDFAIALSETVDDALFSIFSRDDDVTESEVYKLSPKLYAWIQKIMEDEHIHLS